jgi:hypothetical protein
LIRPGLPFQKHFFRCVSKKSIALNSKAAAADLPSIPSSPGAVEKSGGFVS